MKCNTKILSFKDGCIIGEDTTILEGMKAIKIGEDTYVIDEEHYIERDGFEYLHTLKLTLIVMTPPPPPPPPVRQIREGIEMVKRNEYPCKK